MQLCLLQDCILLQQAQEQIRQIFNLTMGLKSSASASQKIFLIQVAILLCGSQYVFSVSCMDLCKLAQFKPSTQCVLKCNILHSSCSHECTHTMCVFFMFQQTSFLLLCEGFTANIQNNTLFLKKPAVCWSVHYTTNGGTQMGCPAGILLLRNVVHMQNIFGWMGL